MKKIIYTKNFTKAKSVSSITKNILSVVLNNENFIRLFRNKKQQIFIDWNSKKHKFTKKKILQEKEDLGGDLKSFFISLAEAYSLPREFAFHLYILAKYNAFPNISDKDFPLLKFVLYENEIKKVLDKNRIVSDQFKYEGKKYKVAQDVGALLFYNSITKKELLAWIDKNWDEIKPKINKLPKTPFKAWGFQDVELTEEIYKLSNNHTLKEVCDILTEKYKNHDEIVDKVSSESWVKTKLKRYKKHIKTIDNFLKENKQLKTLTE